MCYKETKKLRKKEEEKRKQKTRTRFKKIHDETVILSIF